MSRSLSPVWCTTRSVGPSAASSGAASARRTLSACAPCEPPSTKMVKRSLVGLLARKLSSSARRMGLPSATVFLRGKNRADDSNEMNTWSTRCPSTRLVKPGMVFCSSTTRGVPVSHAANSTGPEA
jgi:hypothetical protein